MTYPRRNRPFWCSVSIFVGTKPDYFIYRYLAPLLTRARRQRRIKRFFFIRSNESGQHVRLRMRPWDGVSPSELLEDVRKAVTTFEGEAGGCAGRVQETTYDRSRAYFGETAASVYSELLNDATSVFSINLSSEVGHARARVVAAVACAVLLFLQESNSKSAVPSAVSRYRDFLLGVLRSFAWRPMQMDADVTQRFRAVLRRMMPGMRELVEADPAARQIVRLLQRAGRRGPLGEFVATHSLHLFCNKNGILPPEEFQLLEALHDEL